MKRRTFLQRLGAITGLLIFAPKTIAANPKEIDTGIRLVEWRILIDPTSLRPFEQGLVVLGCGCKKYYSMEVPAIEDFYKPNRDRIKFSCNRCSTRYESTLSLMHKSFQEATLTGALA